MIRRIILSSALVLGALGCATDLVSPSTDVEYALESIDGAPLPFIMLTDYDITVAVLSDVIRLRADSTFLEIARFRGVSMDSELVVADSVVGTYTVSGQTMFLLTTSAASARMTIDGNTLSQDIGRLLVYRRR